MAKKKFSFYYLLSIENEWIYHTRLLAHSYGAAIIEFRKQSIAGDELHYSDDIGGNHQIIPHPINEQQ